ncbi:MAG TPA: FAD-dependent oxidoreductase, partial [Luteolibacter sp.]|nr:FAD-dependent oxidoreductase [Luteolibacter sp.]
MLLSLLGLLPLTTHGANPAVHQVDVAVYCDNPGGVTAAIQVARMGKKVLLISPNGHPGGLTASGLGYTDIGNIAILGGLSHEFHHRAYLHYQKPEAWTFEKQDQFANKGQGGPALDHQHQLASTFEPKVAEAIFRAMLEQNKVKVVIDRLDRSTIQMKDRRIESIRLERSGDTVQAGMFIDASYEGDLMALAGVTFTVGREANATYGELGNGIVGPLGKNQLPKGI